MDLVTGATGFVGPHLVRGLVARGRRVRCLVRDRSRSGALEGPEVEVRQGDLLDPAVAASAAEGIERIFHLAGGGKVSTSTGGGLELLRAANVGPLQAVLVAAKRACVERVVHFSSISAMGVQLDVRLDEDSPCKPVTPHEITKYESEQVARAEVSAGGVPVVILRPSQIYGPGDFNSEIPKLIRLARRGLVPIFDGGRGLVPWVFVSDVVDAALSAGDRAEAPGRTYIVSDSDSYLFAAVVAAIARALGRRRAGVLVPRPLAWSAIGLVEVAARVAGRDPPFTLHRLESVCGKRLLGIDRARRELGYVPRVGLDEGIGRTVTWCIERGIV
jgi:nucleoside-diphosphate-sugar epimerase